jgi:tetratricopeptide (TPR) repeat protein
MMTIKGLLVRASFLPLAISVIGFAQAWPLASGSAMATPISGSGTPLRDQDRSRTVFLSGKVVVDEGMPLPQSAAIEMNCGGRLYTEGYTDAKGYFSFQLRAARNLLGSGGGDTLDGAEDWYLCELQANLSGFISERIALSSASGSTGVIQSPTIVLHPVTRAEGNMVSATSAAAPAKAQKEFQKGCEEAQKSRWDAARGRFQKAVALYPKYAEAWLDLGRVQVQQGQFEAARQSFQQALSADAKLVGAYGELADLALREKHWQELADTTDHILQLDPAGPQYWYLNSAANYELKKVDKAEKSVLQGLRVDVRNAIPKMQYLLAAILALKKDYRGAAEHIRSYLRLAPHADDAQVAQKQLQQLERLSGAAE